MPPERAEWLNECLFSKFGSATAQWGSLLAVQFCLAFIALSSSPLPVFYILLLMLLYVHGDNKDC